MIQLFGWFAFATLAYGASLVVLAPASYLAGFAPAALKPFIWDARGSAWNGRISLGSRRDSSVDLLWRFDAIVLAEGCAKFSVDNSKLDVHALVRGQVTVCPLAKSVTLTDFDVHTNMAQWTSLASRYVEELEGVVAMTLQRVEWSRDKLQAQGRFVWRAARVYSESSVSLGEVTGDVHTEGNAAQVRVENFNGEISLSGRLLLSPDGSYQLNGTVDPRDNTGLAHAMDWLGVPASDGSYRVRFVGQL